MKKMTYKIISGIMMVMFITSCQTKLEEDYINPETTSDASIPKFFTKMLDNDRVRPSYWNVRTFLVMQPAVYTQTASFTNANKRFQQQASYISDFWRDYYTPTGSGIVAHLREIEKTYASLSAANKVKMDVFMNAARVVYYDQTSQLVDLWGDIPFSEAGKLNLSGDLNPPKFDDAAQIYATLISGLKDAATYFNTTTLDPSVSATFNKQDILLQGNMNGWARYANSIRLRLLMRTSFVNEASVQTEVMNMLSDPSNFPLVDDASYNVLLSALTTYNDNMNSALTELNSHIAPEFLLDGILKPASDPRIRVLFDKGVDSKGVYNADYFSMPASATSTDQDNGITNGKYALLDSATFRFNKLFPGIVITASEVNFLKAEAYQRWGSTVNAKTAYEKAVTQAVKFVFDINQSSSTASKNAYVTDTEITNLLVNATVAYVGTPDQLLAKIWTQKWLSFGFIQSIQGWAELRRTKYPVLTFIADNTPGSELPPSRLLYPSTEKVYNADNYAKVASADVATGKVFWDVK